MPIAIKPITTKDVFQDKRLFHAINGIENRILEMCDISEEVTRSDLQGMVTVAAINIYNQVKGV